MRIKICGITKPEQGKAIAELGATTLGFICVERSPRYVTPETIAIITEHIPVNVERIGVFANATQQEIATIVTEGNLTGVQLHGDESPQFCQKLSKILPSEIELIKALRIKNLDSLTNAQIYYDVVDTILLDAYHTHLLGGTGTTLNWKDLINFQPPLPWLLAGGLTPDNILEALERVQPHGIDLSSGVERSPGDKDLDKVAKLFQQLDILGNK
ncbi:MAG: phosphoribosylanthranilate isomerase [Xenococcaceae cyanobacterium MO_188.B32]|nr:phosphoribosylanthranilate isomerase [Xenococcaceae cyanobacterium MO_188.B32]